MFRVSAPTRLVFASMLAANAACGALIPDTRTLTPDEEQCEDTNDCAGQSSGRPAVLWIAIDGVERDLLYAMLREGALPGLASLLGGQHRGGAFPHAYFDETLLSTLPSSTVAAWATSITGVPPSVHGVAGNEYFIREETRFVAPVGVSVVEVERMLAIYTDGYANELLEAPTLYRHLQENEPGIRIWSSLMHFYDGADLLVMPGGNEIADAAAAWVEEHIDLADSYADYEALDAGSIETIVETLEDNPAPDVLTVYLPGTDLYAHEADEGPDLARRRYLREALDPQLRILARALAQQGALDDRYVVVTSDHGHVEVMRDDAHSLFDEPPAVLRHAGFHPREFESETDEGFDAVLAYQGAIAYVYVADRASCVDVRCEWSRPPRFEEDVLPVADAFFVASQRGEGAPAMRGTLDLVLTRRPVPFAEDDRPFEVYVGDGELVPLEAYLAEHPRLGYVAFDERLRDLAVGRYGERAGDVLLLANSTNRTEAADRYYFAEPDRSWHGSPGRKDSEVPLIVAHPWRQAGEIGREVSAALGPNPRLQRVHDVILRLRGD